MVIKRGQEHTILNNPAFHLKGAGASYVRTHPLIGFFISGNANSGLDGFDLREDSRTLVCVCEQSCQRMPGEGVPVKSGSVLIN